MKEKIGTVYLVGAGPGDPGLITEKALRLIQNAQVIFYDNLVNPDLLRNAPSNAKRIDVGKRGEGTSAEQKIIEEQIVAAAKKGKRVVRLKGGDPFIFGRGGEEAERLANEGIPFEVVPGVTSPIAVPAYAGIPLTHRDFTQTVVFVTGHGKGRSQETGDRRQEGSDLDWDALAKMGTIVFVMGVKTIRRNMDALMGAGRDPKTPVAVIRWGTTPKQKTIVGTVGDIGKTIEEMNLMPPAIIVVGEVVRLREEIKWFESKPLFGKRILVTRARAQASDISRRLSDLGAEVIEIPTIEIVPPSSWKDLDRALRGIQKFDWILFTSVNGVDFFMKRLKDLKMDIRDLVFCHLGAVGEATAGALEKFRLRVERVPDKFTGKDLANSFPTRLIRGKKILIPHAKEGREDLADDLLSKGAKVTIATAYINRLPKDSPQKIKDLLKQAPLDLLTFASSSAVQNFHRLLKKDQRELFLAISCLCIGPLTAKTAKDLGFQRVVTAPKATIDSMMNKIIALLAPLS